MDQKQTMIILPEGFTEQNVISVDYNTLNNLIASTFDLDDFDGHLESPNDSTHSFDGINGTLDDYDKEQLNAFIEQKGCEHYSLGVMLNALCNKGVLPPGDYLVSVCW